MLKSIEDQFLEYLEVQRKYSQHSIVAYRNDLKQLAEYLFNAYTLTIQEATTPMLRSWMVFLISNGFSPRTIHRKISGLRAFIRYQIKNEYVKSNPTLGLILPKVAKKLPVFIPQKQTQNLLDTIAYPETFDGSLQRTICWLLYCTGIRVSELVSLKDSNIDFYNQQLKVLGKRNKERIIPFTKELLDVLYSYKQLKNQLNTATNLFLVKKNGKIVTTKFAYLTVKTYLGQVTTEKKKSPHVLRHSIATHMLENGADLGAVRDLLGHTSLASTQVYIHNTIKRLKEVHQKSHPKA